MSNDRRGACMCGEVTFVLTEQPRFVKECVCESCRRAHGATVVGWVGVQSDQFEVTSGERALVWYSSSADSDRGFCSRCGTRLFFRSRRWPGETHVTLMSLEEPHGLQSTGFSFSSELPSWTAVHLREES